MKDKIDFAFSFKGTITRKEFFLSFAVLFLLEFILGAIIGSTGFSILWSLVVICFWSQLAICVKRLRDSGHTWKWLLVVIGIACVCSMLSYNYERQANIAYVTTMVKMKDATPQQIRSIVAPMHNLAATYRTASSGIWIIFFLILIALPSKKIVEADGVPTNNLPIKHKIDTDKEYYNITVSAYQSLKSTYPQYEAEFNILEPLVKEALKDTEATRHEYDEKKTNPFDLALLLTTNAIADEIPYGNYFVYRGCLSMQGQRLYNLFMLTVNELERIGYYSKEKADEDRAWMKKTIADMG